MAWWNIASWLLLKQDLHFLVYIAYNARVDASSGRLRGALVKSRLDGWMSWVMDGDGQTRYSTSSSSGREAASPPTPPVVTSDCLMNQQRNNESPRPPVISRRTTRREWMEYHAHVLFDPSSAVKLLLLLSLTLQSRNGVCLVMGVIVRNDLRRRPLTSALYTCGQ